MENDLRKQDIFKTFDALIKKYPQEHRDLLRKYTGSKFDTVNLKDAIILGLTDDAEYYKSFDLLVNTQMSRKETYSNMDWIGTAVSMAGGLISGVLGNAKSKRELEAQRIRLEAENKAKAQRTLMIAVVGGLLAVGVVGFLIYTKKK